jgi:hypothetical protein
VYPIGDLLERRKDGGETSAEELVKMIQTRVAADSWAKSGGSGTITFHAANASLIIRNNWLAHAAIADILAELRKDKEPRP